MQQTNQISVPRKIRPYLFAAAVSVIPLLAVAVIAVAVSFSGSGSGHVIHARSQAPGFSLPDQTGRIHKLSDYRGRPVALAFIPSGDAASVAELRSLESAIRSFDTVGMKVFAVSPFAESDARRIHDGEKLDFPVLHDEGNRIARAYGDYSDNTADGRLSVVVGPDGRVLLPIQAIQTNQHGKQVVELTECCLDTNVRAPAKDMGRPVVDFTLPNACGGRPESLYGDRKQQATVLLFLSALCPCSAKYDQRNIELARLYAPKSVRFVAVNSSSNESVAEIAEHARRVGLPFPVLKDRDNVIADRLGSKVTPEVFVMDRNGVLRYHGGIDDSRDPRMVQAHHLRNALDFLLAGKLPPKQEAITFGCAIFRAEKSVARSGG